MAAHWRKRNRTGKEFKSAPYRLVACVFAAGRTALAAFTAWALTAAIGTALWSSE